MIDAGELYEKVLNRAALEYDFDGVNLVASRHDQVFRFSPQDGLDLIGRVGYARKRWLDFLRDYIDPVSFAKFLTKAGKGKDGVEVSYTFPVYARHSSGNCLLALTANSQRLRCYSRICLWAPTGALDITLLNEVARRLHLDKVEWHISLVRLNAEKALPALRNFAIVGKSPLLSAAKLSTVSTGKGTSDYDQRRRVDRINRALSRDGGSIDYNLDEFLNYAKELDKEGDITPESIAKLKPGLRGITVRNFLRYDVGMRWWGSANHYLGENTYQWASYSDPLVKRILAHFEITLEA